MNFIKKAFSAMGVLCMTLGVCSVVNATKNNVFNDYIEEEAKPFRALVMGKPDAKKTKMIGMMSGKYYDYLDPYNYNVMPPYDIISVENDGKSYNVTVDEFPYQNRFQSINKLYYRNTDMGLIVYNAGTLNDSLEDIQSWINDYKDYAHNDRIILVANIKSKVGSFDDDTKIVQQHLRTKIYKYIFVSTNTGEGIGELTDFMGNICSNIPYPERNQGIDITSNRVNSGNKCCR